MISRTHKLTIRTPEGVDFALPLASPVTRCLAWAIDLAVLLGAGSVLGSVIGLLRIVSADAAGALGVLSYFVLSIGYGMAMEGYANGQTLGKRVLRLRVMDERGLRLRFPQVAIRNLLRFVDSLPAFYLVGGVAALCTRHAQRLGDVAAGTIVVRLPRPEAPDLAQLASGKFNSFRQHPHLEARLRQLVTPAEASLTLSAVMRRDELDAGARVEFFRALAEHFRALVPMPPEVDEDLADEQYVRNVLDTVYRRPGGEARA